VTGAGGGTGTTTIALHLAARLAASRSTCLVDHDLRWGAGPRLGLAEGHRTWRDFDGSRESLRTAAIPVSGGFRALVSPGRESADAAAAAELLDAAAAEFDCLIVDACPELLDVVLERAAAAVAVAAPTPVSARRARALIEAHPGVPWAVVTNRTGPGGETLRGGLQRIIGRPITLELPCAPVVRDAEDEPRLPGSRRSRWSARVDRLAAALGRTLEAR
jgi:MinD superfamily P-loop ATPase